MNKFLLSIALVLALNICGQQVPPVLTVEKIMQDPKWIGTSPSNHWWTADGRYLVFSWNPVKAFSDSLYYITVNDRQPRKAGAGFREKLIAAHQVAYNSSRTGYVFSRQGDIVYVFAGREHIITRTAGRESQPVFSDHDRQIVFMREQNLYSWNIAGGQITQLTDFRKGSPARKKQLTAQEEWLQRDQLRTSEVLQQKKLKREAAAASEEANSEKLRVIHTGDRNPVSVQISPSGRYISYRLAAPSEARNTMVPDYVTESGFTAELTARPKVGAPSAKSDFYIYDRMADTIIRVNTEQIPGITDQPDFLRDYPGREFRRDVTIYSPRWSPDGRFAVVEIRSDDNKDRWLMRLDPETGTLHLLDRQRDEAWIGGPIGWPYSPGTGSEIWIDGNNFWYRSEASGFAHLYRMNIMTGEKRQLTSGNYEVQTAMLSPDKKYFYITANQVHPGEKHFYRLPAGGGIPEKLTAMTGSNDVVISPDQAHFAILHSYSNRPWELYLQENRRGGKIHQVTTLAQSPEFAAYPWRDPEIVSFTASDGAQVPARLYRPASPHPSQPAVIFVHGAGYLQNVHRWWSQYFREYMFHNLLADLGYTVLDIDYRASAGYGRDWRTAIYRHMGGVDLSDQVDGARFLVEQYGVDPSRIGIYGGSYGGFITLMAMFTQPGVFRSGAALRSVTDWAHYNDPYTSNILNTPYDDSIAFMRSSPVYFAGGLEGHLLMCHGMVDVNVHFQDIVRLTQRLIELGKENWELAVYPVEDHAFTEPSSWTDEYKRILKLFESTLK